MVKDSPTVSHEVLPSGVQRIRISQRGEGVAIGAIGEAHELCPIWSSIHIPPQPNVAFRHALYCFCSSCARGRPVCLALCDVGYHNNVVGTPTPLDSNVNALVSECRKTTAISVTHVAEVNRDGCNRVWSVHTVG